MNEKGESWFNYVNGNVYDIFEVLPEKVYSDHNFVYNIMDRKDRIIFYRDIIYSFNNLNNQHKIITSSGKVKYISTQAKPEKLSNGNVVWYGYSEEVTERIKEEEILKESEEKLRFISENTSDGIIFYEKSGITYTSSSYVKLFGYQLEEQAQKTEQDILNLIHPEDKFNVLNQYQVAKLAQKSNLIIEYRYLHKNGYYVWREDSLSFIYNNRNEVYKIIIIARDITSQKQQELKLKELALVASKTNDAIILTDENAKILLVNNAFEKMTEYSLEEVIGKEQKDLLSGTNTNWNMIHKMMDSTKKFEPVNATLLNYTKSGKPIWFDISLTPVFDDFEVCTNFIDVKKDATERVEKHQQLQELTKITYVQNERLLNFTYIISHNIRSHSANISGIVNLIEVSENLEEKETFFQMLKISTNNLEETIQNLNEIISIQSNSNQNYSTLNLKLEIEKTFAIVIDSIKSSGINIENKASETINLNVIPAYLDSILLNLITNVIKYRSFERDSFLKITSIENENYFIISFEDNGLGLNLKKHKEKLFGMYKTFHKNLNSKGLGLFITKNQIEAMDGKIEVESEENKGSTFKIFFPKNKIDNI